ncbi:MAG: hypothetical protein M3Z98_06245 [Candidatus Dormibacteraeota bacterium]|nr:hypothetical protein [Candidatus Dormibacteraeota bacterium]
MKGGVIRSPRIRRSTSEQVAYHEAGHVVVGHRLGLTLVDVDVLDDREGGHGHTNFETPSWFRRDGPLDDRQKAFAEAVITTFLAGTIAESRRAGFENWEAAGFDLDDVVRDWLLLLFPASEARQRLPDFGQVAARLIDDPSNREAIEKLARALGKRRRLAAPEALAAAGLSG